MDDILDDLKDRLSRELADFDVVSRCIHYGESSRGASLPPRYRGEGGLPVGRKIGEAKYLMAPDPALSYEGLRDLGECVVEVIEEDPTASVVGRRMPRISNRGSSARDYIAERFDVGLQVGSAETTVRMDGKPDAVHEEPMLELHKLIILPSSDMVEKAFIVDKNDPMWENDSASISSPSFPRITRESLHKLKAWKRSARHGYADLP